MIQSNKTHCFERSSAELPEELAGLLHVMRYGRILPIYPLTKKPWLRSVIKDATYSIEVINEWVEKKPGCGWGCRIDHRRLIVLDLEGPAKGDGLATMRELVSRYGPLPKGPLVRTPSDGEHRYLMMPEGSPTILKNWCGILPGLDVRVRTGMVVLPPTQMSKGGYRWEMPLGEEDPPVIPDWLLEKLIKGNGRKARVSGVKTERRDNGPVPQPATASPLPRTTVREFTKTFFPRAGAVPGEKALRSNSEESYKLALGNVLARKLFLMCRDAQFQRTWNKQRHEFIKQDDQPDKSKYEMSIADRALACGCEESEAISLIRYWYKRHRLDSSTLAESRLKCTIETARNSTAEYRAEWEARRPAPKRKLRSIILEFAIGRASFDGNQILRTFDGISDAPASTDIRQMLITLVKEGLIQRVRRGKYALADQADKMARDPATSLARTPVVIANVPSAEFANMSAGPVSRAA